MTRFLIDVNVVLDVLLDRAPHAEASSSVWAAVETGRAEGLISAHAVTTVHYLVARDKDARVARRVIETLLGVFGVAPVTEAVLRSALDLRFADFEDAVCAAAAAAAGCDALVTRDVGGFRKSTVPVLTPSAAAAMVGVQSDDFGPRT
jgi:predicted nucleic acid-binding protein